MSDIVTSLKLQVTRKRKSKTMKNIQDIVNMNLCYGCSACYCVCPKGYIKYKEDGGMGFPIPNVVNCEDCGSCLRVCSMSESYEDGE